MTAEEIALVNKIKAETGQILIVSGAIDAIEERERITTDTDSGYNGLVQEDIDLDVIESDLGGQEYD